MTIMRWRPATDLTGEFLTMQREVDRMFDRFRGDVLSGGPESGVLPSVDVAETENEFILNVELPGVNKEDVKITVEDSLLTIRGEKKQESEKKTGTFHRVERSFGSFERSFTIPGFVRRDGIEANFSNGVLKIRIPKAEEAKPKEIDVKVH